MATSASDLRRTRELRAVLLPRPPRPAAARYAASAAAWLLALALTAALAPYVGRANFVFFWGAVLFAAWYGGLVPALLGAVAAVAAVDWLFVEPRRALGVPTAADLLVFSAFVAVSAMVSGLTASAVRAQRRSEAQARELAELASRLEEQAVELEQQAEEAQSLSEELSRANERLAASAASAEAANRAKSDFLAMMSHELRTPLNAIAGYAELLGLGIRGPVTAEQREDLTRITRAQRHLLGLINDVLNFARIDAGRVAFRVTEVPLDEVLAGVAPLVEPLLAAKRIRFALEPCPAGLLVWADAEKVQQVLVNLLSNAAKFTPAGGGVRVWCEAGAREATVLVRDSGVGIPRDRLADVFDPFVQVGRSPAQPAEGTGLGLAISREIVRAHGGRIWAESEVGAGSTFAFTLPRERPADLPPDGERVLLAISPPAGGWRAPGPAPDAARHAGGDGRDGRGGR